ncbi:MAG: hypothetical protein JNM94_18125 [Phycisphaerae bacterium]|nr:hypothetical protein [Phycisphaerae bacterium]
MRQYVALGLSMVLAATACVGSSAFAQATKLPNTKPANKKVVLRPGQTTPRAAQQPAATPAPRAVAQAAQQPAAVKTFTILYDWAPDVAEVKSMLEGAGAKPYMMIYQNVDPNAQATGKIDVSKLIADVKQRFGPNPSGWGMLDYEVPFDSVLQKGPSDPLYATCTSEMVNAIRKMKEAFPNVKWTYYGIPGLAYWPKSNLWELAPADIRAWETDRQITGYGPVLRELDWYSPCVYDCVDNSKSSANWKDPMLKNEHSYRKGRIEVVREFLRRNNLPMKPIIPSVTPFYAPGSNAIENGVISAEEILRDQIIPVVAAEADGIAIWTCGNWYVQQATLPTNTNNSTQVRVREEYKKGFLGGNEPAAWNTEGMKSTLLNKVGMSIAGMAKAARDEFNRANANRTQTAAVTNK